MSAFGPKRTCAHSVELEAYALGFLSFVLTRLDGAAYPPFLRV